METAVIESEVESQNKKITVEALSIIIENTPAIKNIKKKLVSAKIVEFLI